MSVDIMLPVVSIQTSPAGPSPGGADADNVIWQTCWQAPRRRRRTLMRLIHAIARRLTRLPVTLFHAMSLADTYMSMARPTVYRTHLSLYACTFVWISSKYHEDAIDLKRFRPFLFEAVSTRNMQNLEALVLQQIDWRIGFDEGMTLIDSVHASLALPRRMVPVVSRVFMWYYIEIKEARICISEIVALCVLVGASAYNELQEDLPIDMDEVLLATAAFVGVNGARLAARYNRSAVAEFVEPWARNEVGVHVAQAAPP